MTRKRIYLPISIKQKKKKGLKEFIFKKVEEFNESKKVDYIFSLRRLEELGEEPTFSKWFNIEDNEKEKWNELLELKNKCGVTIGVIIAIFLEFE